MPSQTALAIYGVITGLIVIAAVLWLLWFGLTRARVKASSRLRSWSATAIILAAWYLGLSVLGARGFFAAGSRSSLLALPLAVFLSIGIGLWYALRNPAIRKAVAALPLPALIAVQVYRVNGLIFVIYTLRGDLPSLFGFTAGFGDIAVGLLAVVSARMLARNAAFARPAAYLWNALGMLDLVTALTIGFLSSSSPLQRFAFDHPNTLIATWPLVMIPVFVVPLSLILHIFSLWQLRSAQEMKHSYEQESLGVPAAGHLR